MQTPWVQSAQPVHLGCKFFPWNMHTQIFMQCMSGRLYIPKDPKEICGPDAQFAPKIVACDPDIENMQETLKSRK